jgi:A/G-specific adenine glycosylase
MPNEFSEKLLAWYSDHQRALPWRGTRDPYRVWVSEIMLQQTQVETVTPYYRRWLKRFPHVRALAAASQQEVLALWEGLGYYARARNFHRAAQKVVADHNGRIPRTLEGLLALPGIGRYTAAAIASIAFGLDVAVLDGNVKRVLARVFNYTGDVKSPRSERELWSLARSLVPAGRAGDYNQALMDLGRAICTPRRPACPVCPVRDFCLARARGDAELRPVKKAKAPSPQVRAVAAVLRDAGGRLLLVQRPAEGLLGGLWALPGGMAEGEESLGDCLRRSLRRDLGVDIEIGGEMAVATQEFTHFRMTLRAYACELRNGGPPASGSIALAWVSPSDIPQYGMGKADRQIVDALDCWQPRLFEEL